MPAAFSEWRNALMPALPGASETAVRAAFLYGAQTFYKRTRAWRVDTGFIPLTADQADVQLPSTAVYAPVMVEGATFDRAPIFFGHKPLYPDPDARGVPLRAWMPTATTLRLWPAVAVDCPESLEITMSVYPLNVDALPDFAATHHFEGLESGALSRLYSQPNAPYTNVDLARFHLQKFTAEVQRAKARVSHGNAGLPPVWSFGVVPPR